MKATMIPAAAVPDPSLLISRYRRVLEAADEVPFVFLVRRRPGRLHWFGRTLRTRVLLRFFIRWHIVSTVAELRRAALGRAASEPCEPCYAAVAERLEHFEKSLRGVRLKQALVVALVSVFLVAFLLARAAPQQDPTLSNLFSQDGGGTSQKIGMRDAADPLANMTGAMLTLNPKEVGSALKSFACVGKSASDCSAHRALISSVTSFILLGIAAWLVAFFPLAAFRLKRTLFNLDADDDVTRRVRARPARDHVATADGIYRLEADLFRSLGHRRHRELPLDLVGQACILVVPLWLAVMTAISFAWGIRFSIRDNFFAGDLTVVTTLALLSVTLAIYPFARLASLRWAQRRRRASATAAPPPVSTATLRRRLLAHLADTLPLVALGMLLVRDAQPFAHSESGRLVAVFAICPLALAVVQGAFIARAGRTFGKATFGLRVLSSDGCAVSRRRLLIREVILKGAVLGVPWLLLPELWRPFAAVPFWFVAGIAWTLVGFAYACSAWNLRRSPLHDLILDTGVTREPRAERAAVPVPALA